MPVVSILMGLGVITASLIPGLSTGAIDKLIHYAAYGVWTFTAVLSVQSPAGQWRVGLGILAIGLGIECLQPLVTRDFSPLDMVANGAGVGMGMLAAHGLNAFGWSGSGQWRVALGALLVVLVLGVPVSGFLRPGERMSTWDCSYPVVVGNEATGDRPWAGELLCARLMVGDLRLEPASDDEPTCGTVAPPGATAMLEVGSATRNGTPGPDAPLQDTATTSFCEAARIADALVLEAWLVSHAKSQAGPARILSFSTDRYRRNLTLGQSGSAFDFRLRTPFTGTNGETVPIRTRAGSVSTDPVRVTAHYRSDTVTLSLSDGVTTGPVPLNPLFPHGLLHWALVMVLSSGLVLTGLAVFGGWKRGSERLA